MNQVLRSTYFFANLWVKATDNLMVSEAHDVRIIGSLTLLLLLGITQAGMAWESKAQVGLLIILLISIINYVVGCFLNREFDYDAFAANDTSELKLWVFDNLHFSDQSQISDQ